MQRCAGVVGAKRHELLPMAQHLDLAGLSAQYRLVGASFVGSVEKEATTAVAPRANDRLAESCDGICSDRGGEFTVIDIDVDGA